MEKETIKIVSTTCVNSHWIASWLAKNNQEYCQCSFNCKVLVSIERSGHKPHTYILTEKEYNNLINPTPTNEGAKTAESDGQKGVDVEKLAEAYIRNGKDFGVEGFSEYQNGKMNGFIDGFKANQALQDNKSDGQRYGDILEWIAKNKFNENGGWYRKMVNYDDLKYFIQTLQSKEQEPKGSEERSDKLEAFLDYCNVNKARIIEDYYKSLSTQEPKGSDREEDGGSRLYKGKRIFP